MTTPQLTIFQNGLGAYTADWANGLLQTCDTTTQLSSFTGVPGAQVYCRGYASPGDGGQGSFYWNATYSGASNGTTVIVPTGAVIGAWLRLSPPVVSPTLPTFTILTNGSGNYTAPTGVVQLFVRLIGGGGGGAASSLSGALPGANGTSTLFGTNFLAGTNGAGSGGVNGGGGGGGFEGDVNLGGATGGFSSGLSGSGPYVVGGFGAGTSFGGPTPGGTNFVASAVTNSGCGGGGGGINVAGNGGGGGGAGGYVEKTLTYYAGTVYPYVVGAGGAGGTPSGTGSNAGGAGADGIIIIKEVYG